MDMILANMKARNEVMKAKKIVWSIEENLLKLLKCYFKNKLMNFENEQLSERYAYLVAKINNNFNLLESYKDIPDFDYNEAIISLKKFKEENKEKFENIAIHENAFTGEKFVKCKRCNGTGHLDHFNHVKSGICFSCDGTCVVKSSKFKKHMALIEEPKDDLPF